MWQNLRVFGKRFWAVWCKSKELCCADQIPPNTHVTPVQLSRTVLVASCSNILTFQQEELFSAGRILEEKSVSRAKIWQWAKAQVKHRVMAWGEKKRFVFCNDSDLNPIENLWRDLKIAVHQHPLSNLGELEKRNICIKECEWKKSKCAKSIETYLRQLKL